MRKRTLDQSNPRLNTNEDSYNGPTERVLGDHGIEAIQAGILTPEGSLALDGGHLPGNKDQLHAGTRTHGPASPVPGATGNAGGGDASESEGEGFTPQDPEPKSGGTIPNFRTADANEASADLRA
jgi:hypothetical protein